MIDYSKYSIGSWYWIKAKLVMANYTTKETEWIPARRTNYLGCSWCIYGCRYINDKDVVDVGHKIPSPPEVTRPGIYRVRYQLLFKTTDAAKKAGEKDESLLVTRIPGVALFDGEHWWIAGNSKKNTQDDINEIGDYLGPLMCDNESI